MKNFTDVIEEQKLLRRGRQDVFTTYVYTVLLILFLLFLEISLFP